VSGGQTGVDRAALDVAISLGIPCGGWCPRGRRAEDGRISERYPMRETADTSYSSRTVQNVADSEGTLILTSGRLSGGTLLTRNTAARLQKPHLVVDPADLKQVESVHDWIAENQIRVLNVAGPRASQMPRAYELTTAFLLRLVASSTRPRKTRRSPLGRDRA
jgi:hypothetical protein